MHTLAFPTDFTARPALATRSTEPSADARIELDSRALLRGQVEIAIRHGGEVYRLRHTRNDKLILTK